MKVEQSFSVARPIGDVWALFKDAKQVAACMPGAELTGEPAPGAYSGRISLDRLGPFSASFEGEATVTYDDAAHAGHVEGKGVDKRGGSRSKMTMDFSLAASGPAATTVNTVADVTLSGAIAQFGRTGLIQESANILIGEFARNLEAHLAPSSPVAETAAAPSVSLREIGGFKLIVLALTAWLRKLLGRRAGP